MAVSPSDLPCRYTAEKEQNTKCSGRAQIFARHSSNSTEELQKPLRSSLFETHKIQIQGMDTSSCVSTLGTYFIAQRRVYIRILNSRKYATFNSQEFEKCNCQISPNSDILDDSNEIEMSAKSFFKTQFWHFLCSKKSRSLFRYLKQFLKISYVGKVHSSYIITELSFNIKFAIHVRFLKDPSHSFNVSSVVSMLQWLQEFVYAVVADFSHCRNGVNWKHPWERVVGWQKISKTILLHFLVSVFVWCVYVELWCWSHQQKQHTLRFGCEGVGVAGRTLCATFTWLFVMISCSVSWITEEVRWMEKARPRVCWLTNAQDCANGGRSVGVCVLCVKRANTQNNISSAILKLIEWSNICGFSKLTFQINIT